MKKQFIKDLKAGDKVSSFFVAKHKQLEYFRDKSKGRFLTIVLADRTGRIVARVWEHADVAYEQFDENDIIAVWGRVDEYLDRPQIIVNRLRQAKATDKAYYSDDDFVPQTDKDLDSLWQVVAIAIEDLTDPHLKTLVQTIVSELGDGLRAAPASRSAHHSYRGGLLEHITEMLALSHCLTGLYPRIDRSLLTAGIILHDIGLIEGARYERDIDYSDSGRLIGHAVLGDRLVAQGMAALPAFPPDLALCLEHMILSHHGREEHGAVREPQTIEAMALYLLSELSAKVNHVQQQLDSQWDTNKPWTDYDRMMDRFYFRGRSLEPQQAPEGPAHGQPPPEQVEGLQPAGPPFVAEPPAQWSGEGKPPEEKS